MTHARALALAVTLCASAAGMLVCVRLATASPPLPILRSLGAAPGPLQAVTPTHTASATLAATSTLTPPAVTATARPGFTLTIEAARATATYMRLVTSGTLAAATETRAALLTAAAPTATATPSTPTATVTPTLGPEWGLDALCRCHVPPLDPDSAECARLKASAVATIVSGVATVTAFARGTDTPTPVPSLTPTPTVTPSTTPIPTDEPTPPPAPTWTPRVVVVTATPAPVVRRAWLPFTYLRRPRR